MNNFGSGRMFAGGSPNFNEGPYGMSQGGDPMPQGLFQQRPNMGQAPQQPPGGMGQRFQPLGGGMGGGMRKPMGGGDPRAMALRAYGQRMQGMGQAPQGPMGGDMMRRPPVMPQGGGMAQPAVMPGGMAQPGEQQPSMPTRMPPQQAPQGEPGMPNTFNGSSSQYETPDNINLVRSGGGNSAASQLWGQGASELEAAQMINKYNAGGSEYKPWLNQLASQGLQAPKPGAMADQWASEGLGSMQGGQWNWAQGKGF